MDNLTRQRVIDKWKSLPKGAQFLIAIVMATVAGTVIFSLGHEIGYVLFKAIE